MTTPRPSASVDFGPNVVFETLDLFTSSIRPSVLSCPSRRRRPRSLSVRPSRRPSRRLRPPSVRPSRRVRPVVAVVVFCPSVHPVVRPVVRPVVVVRLLSVPLSVPSSDNISCNIMK